MAPVVRYRKQTRTWIKGGRGLLRLVGCARFGRRPIKYMMVCGWNRKRSNTSSSSNVSRGFERSLNNRGRLCWNNNLRRNCLLCAAIFIYLFEYDSEDAMKRTWKILSIYSVGVWVWVQHFFITSSSWVRVLKSLQPTDRTHIFQWTRCNLDKINLKDKQAQIYNVDETGISTEHTPPMNVCGQDVSLRSSNLHALRQQQLWMLEMILVTMFHRT